jgi:cell division protein FtsB
MTRLGFHLRRQWPSLILAGVLLILVITGLWGPLSPRDLITLRQHRVELEAQRQALLDHNATLRTSIQKLRSDDHYLEHLVRSELGYARPGDLIYKFADETTPPPSH